MSILSKVKTESSTLDIALWKPLVTITGVMSGSGEAGILPGVANGKTGR